MHNNIEILFEKYLPQMAEEFKSKDLRLKDFQKSVIDNVLNGSNTLCIMPTGGGKSLIYWLSGLALDGITIVISPLIALIDEQASKIKAQGYEVLSIHGGMDASKQTEILTQFCNKELNPNFIFVSPERMATDGFFEFCIKARKDDIKLIAIDEVHCVSQWGFSFRPFYKRIPVFLEAVFEGEMWPRILGLTATLNSKEIIDICEDFRITKNNIIKDDLLMRSEIALKILKFQNEDEKEEKFWQLLNIHKDEKVLVYLYRKYHERGVEDLTEKAKKKGLKAISFHGDMSSKERQDIINSYKDGKIDVIFATNAFGMGIDIPDIRVVIHFMLPESVEQYYQEVGRAARDGRQSNAYLLYTNKNIQVKRTHFIDKSFPSTEMLKDVYEKITNNCKGLKTLQYFSDEEIQACLPYFLDNGLLTVKCKGITNLDIFSKVESEELINLCNLTKTKGFITTIKKAGIEAKVASEIIYSAVINGKAKLSKNFDKCLIVEGQYEEVLENKLQELSEYTDEKKSYKHKLFDYFVYLLDGYVDSSQLHQEIGKYLGVPKHKLNKIYRTLNGDLVRSKSEVIIANLLYENNIKYEYEKKLFFTQDKWIEPDFTINLNNGEEIYWEHLGMIGTEKYDNRWSEKLNIYESYFPGKLEITYEGTVITNSAMILIDKLKK